MRYQVAFATAFWIIFQIHNSRANSMFQEFFISSIRTSNYFDDVFILNSDSMEAYSSVAGTKIPTALLKLADFNMTEAFHRNGFSRTAVFVVEANQTWLLETFSEVVPLLSHRNPFYFFLLPTEDFEFYKTTTTSLCSLFRLHSDAYWITANRKMWETYSVKEACIVKETQSELTQGVLTTDLTSSKWKRRQNFQQVNIVATAALDESSEEEVRYARDSNGTDGFETSLAVDIFRLFRDHLNFSEKSILGEFMLEEVPRPGLKRIHTQLADGNADVAISLSAFEYKKAQLATFLHSSYRAWQRLWFKAPQSMWMMYIRPFDTPVWFVILVYSIVMLALIWIFRWVLRSVEERAQETQVEFDILWIMSTLCMQGWHYSPDSNSLRIIFFVASTTGFLLNAAYSGLLTSQLSIKESPYFTLETLLDWNYEFYIENDNPFPIDLEQYPKWMNTKVIEVEAETKGVPELNKVTERKAALLTSTEYYRKVTEAGNYSEAEACDLCSSVKVGVTPVIASMTLPKGSEFKEIFNILTLRAMETGILVRLRLNYKGKRLRCQTDEHVVVPQTMIELSLPYVALAVGMVLSLCILAAEIVISMITVPVIRS